MSDETIYTDPLGSVIIKHNRNVYSLNHPDLETARLLDFQVGAPLAAGVTGFTNEALIAIVLNHIQAQNNIVPCEDNSSAIRHLKYALLHLEDRAASRKERGVDGREIA